MERVIPQPYTSITQVYWINIKPGCPLQMNRMPQGYLLASCMMLRNLLVLVEAVDREDHKQATSAAIRTANVMVGFLRNVVQCMSVECFTQAASLWKECIQGIAAVARCGDANCWKQAKLLFCNELCLRKLPHLAKHLFFDSVDYFARDPRRALEPGLEPVPAWFAERVFAEVSGVDLLPV